MFRVDKLTNCLENTLTGEIFDAEIYELQKTDLQYLTKENGWHFDWNIERNNSKKQVYKLVLYKDTAIQGLISIEERPNYLFLPLIETAPHNFGKQKKYKGVAKGLTAFACKRSFELGYEGEVTFVSKTKLIEHYKKQLGAAVLSGQRMLIYGESARKLVSLFFKEFTS